MRSVTLLLVVLAAGCPKDTTPPSGMCESDSQCGGDVCARDGECLPANMVGSATISWTIRGMAASPTTCANSPEFYLNFDSSSTGEAFGFAPVPCQEGNFHIDKLPIRFDEVEIGINNQPLSIKPIRADGTVSFDLSP
jgi:hypothetical protein